MISQYIRFSSLILISLIVLVGCGGGATSEPAAATSAPAATPTPEPATPTPEPPTPTPAPATPTPVTEKITFEFVSGLSTVEEMDDDIAPELERVEGILRVSGTEVSITITYDPEIIRPEELRAALAEIGHAVKE